MEKFMVIVASVIYEAKKRKLVVKHEKIKKAMCYTVTQMLYKEIVLSQMGAEKVKS